jgi:hypothetical protein
MVIRQEILDKHMEAAAIEQLADDYSRQGYEIEREADLDGLQADLVARKGDQVLVFEIKAGSWTDDKRKAAQRLRDAAVQKYGARFVLVLTPQPREKSIEIDGIEEILLEMVSARFESELSQLATHTRVDEIADVDLTAMSVGPEGLEVEGSAAVELELRHGSDTDQEEGTGLVVHETAPLKFHLLLGNDLRPERVIEARLDLEGLSD